MIRRLFSIDEDLASDQTDDMAVKLLEQRLSELQLLINAHMHILWNFKPINTCDRVADIKSLRRFYDAVEVEIIGLTGLGLGKNNLVNSMLIPVLMSKLPAELKLIMSRSFGEEEVWDLTKVLDVFRSELVAREKIVGAQEEVVSTSFLCKMENKIVEKCWKVR